MKKQLVILGIIGITTIILTASILVILSKNSENMNADSELNKFVGKWQPTFLMNSVAMSYVFRQDGTYVYSYDAFLTNFSEHTVINGTFQIINEKLYLTNTSGGITIYNYTFSENDTILSLELPDLDGRLILEKT